MTNKYLEKSAKIEEGNEKTLELNYYILENENVLNNRVYGIEIEKKIGNGHYERFLINDLYPNIQDVKNTVDKLAQNTVTPVALPFIIEDILGT